MSDFRFLLQSSAGRLAPSLRGLSALPLAAVLVWSQGPVENGWASAQEPPPSVQEIQDGGDWNHPRVLELVERGRQARRALAVDGDLESYRALTEGHIYFFVDPEEGERALIRVDQVAVELRWQAPNRVRQHIVGERSETRLPVREFSYYLDRLTLVQYGFGDEIQVGHGMDVAGVPHPLAPLPEGDPDLAPYDYRLSDSLSLTLPARDEPVRLYELEVRPRDPSAPGILGSIVLDRAGAEIVRMAFTFTPASYVDPRTDRISVELDYGLWEDRYWLPNRQRIEVRRELPELDLGVGTVIRAVLRVGDYELNVPFAEELFPTGTQVTAAPREAREGYAFSEGLYEGLARHGLADVALEVDPRELRARATELLRQRPVSGLSPLRLHLPGFSDAIRYNRAEGLFLGAGGSYRPRSDLGLRAHGGYALGEDRLRGSARMEGLAGDRTGWSASVKLNALDDVGLVPGGDALLSSLSAVFLGEDFRDPFRATGFRLGLERSSGGSLDLEVGAGGERHRSMTRSVTAAPLDSDRSFRPVRPVTEGDFVRLDAAARLDGLRWPGAGRGSARLALDLLAGSPGSGIGIGLGSSSQWGPPSGVREVRLTTEAWSWLGDPLLQGHRLMGGRRTLPGFPFRSFVGRHLAQASLGGATDLLGPHLRLHGGLHAGWAGGGDPEVLEAWDATGTRKIRASATLGVGLAWDLLRVEGARGLNGGEWQLLISLDPRWWDWL